MAKCKILVVPPFIICEVMPVCIVKILHFRSVLEYAEHMPVSEDN